MTENTEHPRKTPNSGNVDIARRNFSRIGAASPILMTLASTPVLGAPCLSNMMSGHLYQDRGQCYYGWSPGGWKNLGGAEPDWEKTPFRPCTMRNGVKVAFDSSLTFTKNNGMSESCGVGNGHQQDACYRPINQTDLCTLGEALSYHNITACGDLSIYLDESLFDILNTYSGSAGGFISHFVTALLNASHSDITYVLSPQQLAELYCDPTKLPVGDDLGTFLDKTWPGFGEGQQ